MGAAAIISEPSLIFSLFPSSNSQFSSRNRLRLRSNRSPLSISICSRPPPTASSSCSCTSSAGTLDPEPIDESTFLNPNRNPNPSSNSIAAAVVSSKEGGKDRRRAVRIAWEKLVRWSRSWRSKAKTDVLERTKKVVILGGGSFGTAMAAHIASKKAELEVSMLVRDVNVCHAINEAHFNCKYFPNHKLPENIVATTSAKDALLGADFCLHAVPVQFIFS